MIEILSDSIAQQPVAASLQDQVSSSINGDVGNSQIVSQEAVEAPLPTKRTATRKLPMALVDKKIELTDNELRLSREQYDEEQSRISADLANKKRDKQAYFYAVDVSRASRIRVTIAVLTKVLSSW